MARAAAKKTASTTKPAAKKTDPKTNSKKVTKVAAADSTVEETTAVTAKRKAADNKKMPVGGKKGKKAEKELDEEKSAPVVEAPAEIDMVPVEIDTVPAGKAKGDTNNNRKGKKTVAATTGKTKGATGKTDDASKADDGKKRTQDKSVEPDSSEPAAKKTKTDEPATSKTTKKATTKKTVQHKATTVSAVYPSVPGFVLVMGEGDTGQLGLGPDVMDRSKPGRVNIPADVVQVCAGGMHSVCLTEKGEVLTFGCNDEGALGRKVEDEDECMSPEKVELAERIVMVSAGDSHTAALSTDGHLFVWGTFRDANGPIGIIPGEGKLESPKQIMEDHRIVKIASGSDHLVCLTQDGDVYTLGAAEQGQLGRVPECFTARGGRRGLKFLLCPGVVTCGRRNAKFSDVWTGQYCTYAKVKDTGDIYVWGLNNYYQLGIPDMQNKFVPEKSESFQKEKDWVMISGGQHHALGLDSKGQVYSLGRKEYGRLGLGEDGLEEKRSPTLVPALQSKKCVCVNSGTAVSFAVTADGSAFGWGMGSTKQLGQGDDEDDVFTPVAISGKQLEKKNALMISAGGQHTLVLARDSS